LEVSEWKSSYHEGKHSSPHLRAGAGQKSSDPQISRGNPGAKHVRG
jgi:hypothetical protein